MKFKAISVFAISLSLLSFTVTAQDTAAIIHQTENSLCPPVHFAGDSMWTLESRMKHYDIAAVSMAVIRDNKILWSKAYGVKDKQTREPATTRTIFQAGSISKPVAAYGALHEMQSGKINLTANVNDYLKSWHLPDNEFTKEKKVTLKNLLSHTGGITVHGFLGYSPDLPVPSLIQVLNGEPPANSPPIRVDKIPGGDPRYSGGGYTIMQQMLIDIESKPFPDIMQELVLRPLGMSSSTYSQPLPENLVASAATGYVPDGSMTKGKRHTYPEMAAAGLWTTAEDLARFAIDVQLSLKGEHNKVLSKKTVNMMLTPFVAEYQGLGLFITNHRGEIYFQHGGWDEGFSSQLTAHKEKGYGVVVLTNANQPDFIEELIRAVALTENWDHYVPTHQRTTPSQTMLKNAAGRFINNNADDVVAIEQDGNKLVYKNMRLPARELIWVSDSTFMLHDLTMALQVKKNARTGTRTLVFIDTERHTSDDHHRALEPGEKVPFEWLLEGNDDRALAEYEKLRKSNPTDQTFSEEAINTKGYDLLSKGKIKVARDLFKINTALYPASWNTYDSYAEACLKNGDKDLAIKNYRKSLQLNPASESAKKALHELGTN